MEHATPTAESAVAIAERSCAEAVVRCERFTTGLRNWVYDVELRSGRQVVVRMSDPAHRAELAGGVYWTRQLGWMEVPVARVLDHELDGAQPYMLLERLAGTDLGNCFDVLDDTELKSIAHAVAHMQSQAGQLPQANGYGYALHYTQTLARSWDQVIADAVNRAEARIRAAGVVDLTLVAQVRARLDTVSPALDQVAPQAFLHDATTKNVIIDDGTVTGLVDVDTMAFGDPLWAVALTRMSLLSAERSTLYSDALLAAMQCSDEAGLLDAYTAVFCLDFLSELGHAFNRDAPAPIDEAFHEHLVTALRDLLG